MKLCVTLSQAVDSSAQFQPDNSEDKEHCLQLMRNDSYYFNDMNCEDRALMSPLCETAPSPTTTTPAAPTTTPPPVATTAPPPVHSSIIKAEVRKVNNYE